jgi:hypothetical protein
LSSSSNNSSSGNNALPPFFISHSGRDIEIVNVILRIFEQYNEFYIPKRPHRIINRDELSRSQKPRDGKYIARFVEQKFNVNVDDVLIKPWVMHSLHNSM